MTDEEGRNNPGEPRGSAAFLRDYPVVLEIPVAWGDMDSLGHVNNTKYFRYFESSRVAYLERIGSGVEGWLCGKTGWILASVSCRFRVPVTYPDTLEVGSRVGGIGEDRLLIKHRAFSRKLGKLVADGAGLVVAYDYQHRCKVDVSEAHRQAICRLEGREPPSLER